MNPGYGFHPHATLSLAGEEIRCAPWGIRNPAPGLNCGADIDRNDVSRMKALVEAHEGKSVRATFQFDDNNEPSVLRGVLKLRRAQMGDSSGELRFDFTPDSEEVQ